MKPEIKLKLKFKDPDNPNDFVEIELSKDEIVELQGVLNGLFPVPVVIEKTVPNYPYYPYRYPMQPYWEYTPSFHPATGVGSPDTAPLITWCGNT